MMGPHSTHSCYIIVGFVLTTHDLVCLTLYEEFALCGKVRTPWLSTMIITLGFILKQISSFSNGLVPCALITIKWLLKTEQFAITILLNRANDALIEFQQKCASTDSNINPSLSKN